MLAGIFYKLMYMSLTASFIGLSIIVIRRFFDKRISPFWKYAMWILVIVALVVPYRAKTPFSPFNDTKNISSKVENIILDSEKEITIGAEETQVIVIDDNANNNVDTAVDLENDDIVIKSETDYFNKAFLFGKLLPVIWLVGVFLLLLNFIIMRIRLSKISMHSKVNSDEKQRIKRILEDCKNEFGIKKDMTFVIQDSVNSPSILGLFKPVILIPLYCLTMSDESLSYILYHELAHYKRWDVLVNYLLLGCQIIYWLNPLMWIIFKYIRDDMEILTDEYVIDNIGVKNRKNYSRSLVEVLANANNIPYMPKMLCMVDGKKNIERRITMLNLGEKFKKHKIFIAIVCITVISVLALVFLTVRKKPHEIAIYTTEGIELEEGRMREVIEKTEPVLTQKDITGYNEDTMMIFLSDEVLSQHKAKEALQEEPYFFRGGSLMLGNERGGNTFIITVDDEIVLAGSDESSVFSSYMPGGFIIKDCTEGLRIYASVFGGPQSISEDEMLKQKESIAKAFEDMGLLTDKLFGIRVSGIDSLYDTNRLYKNHRENLDANIDNLIKNLLLPNGTIYEGFSINNSNTPPSLIINLKVEDKEELEWYFKRYSQLVEFNAEIMFALVGDLSLIEMRLNSGAGSLEQSMYYVEENEYENNPFYGEKKSGLYWPVRKAYDSCKTIFNFYEEFEFSAMDKEISEDLSAKDHSDGEAITEENKEAYIRIESALEEMVDAPILNSSVEEYVYSNEEAFKTIASEGDLAVEYMLSEFEKGKGEGLRGTIMAELCRIIDGVNADVGEYATGEEWYEKYINRKRIDIPDYENRDENEITKLVYDKYYQKSDDDAFKIFGVKVYDYVLEEDKLKVFSFIEDHKFRLYQNPSGEYVVYDYGFFSGIRVLTYNVDQEGGYTLEKEEYPKEGGKEYTESLRKICKTPVTNLEIEGLFDDISSNGQKDLTKIVVDSLKAHLKDNGIDEFQIISRNRVIPALLNE